MKISTEEKEAINNFFDCVKKLRGLNIIRSDRILGDIGEFFAARAYDLTLAKSKRQTGHDTEGADNKIQIKFHNSPTRTNVDLGNPELYEHIIIVIGPDSLLHPRDKYSDKILFYKFSSSHVKDNFKNKKSFSCGRKSLTKPNKEFSLGRK